MSSFALDDNNDLLITNNKLTLTTGLEAIRQHMQVKFKIFLGEWFLDVTVGVPWFEDILKKQVSFVVVQEILKDVILSTEGVTELLTFDFDYDLPTRAATLEFKALTDLGIVDFTDSGQLQLII